MRRCVTTRAAERAWILAILGCIVLLSSPIARAATPVRGDARPPETSDLLAAAAAVPRPPMESLFSRPGSAATRSAEAWRGGFCTPAGCRPARESALPGAASFGLCALAAGAMARRRRPLDR
jgi:hypothetical protein